MKCKLLYAAMLTLLPLLPVAAQGVPVTIPLTSGGSGLGVDLRELALQLAVESSQPAAIGGFASGSRADLIGANTETFLSDEALRPLSPPPYGTYQPTECQRFDYDCWEERRPYVFSPTLGVVNGRQRFSVNAPSTLWLTIPAGLVLFGGGAYARRRHVARHRAATEQG